VFIATATAICSLGHQAAHLYCTAIRQLSLASPGVDKLSTSFGWVKPVIPYLPVSRLCDPIIWHVSSRRCVAMSVYFIPFMLKAGD